MPRLTWKPLAAGGAAIILLIGLIAAFTSKSSATGTTQAGAASAKSIEPGEAAPPPPEPDAVGAWRKAGMTVSAFAPVDGGALGGTCQAGTVNGVDVELCTFTDDGAAKKAQDAGYAVVGATTGISLAQGDTLLIAADRKKADAQGRTINQLAKLFRAN